MRGRERCCFEAFIVTLLVNEREREGFAESEKSEKIFENRCCARARMMLKQNEITNDVGLDALARRVGRAVGLSISST